MTHSEPSVHNSVAAPSELATLIHAIPPARRGVVLQSVLSFRPAPTLEKSFAVGPLRAAFADYWEARFGETIPVERLRAVLEPPVPIGTVLEFNKLMLTRDAAEIEDAAGQLADHLAARLPELDRSTQLAYSKRRPQPADPAPAANAADRGVRPQSAEVGRARAEIPDNLCRPSVAIRE
jgi:hypothetical protein